MHAQTSAVPVSTTPVLEERAATADATPTRMAERHRRWLAEVEPLIAPPERALFLALGRDYQRDAFVERFWRVRDPYPRTARNELKERWPLRVAEAKSRFGTLQDDRAVMLMVHGEPAQTQRIRCTGNYAPAEIWAYAGSDWVDVGAVMVFLIHRRGEPAVLWRPGQFSARDEGLLSRVQGCYQGGQLLALLGSLQNEADAYSSSLQRYLIKPRPTSTEWVDTFAAYTTDAPAEGAHLAGDLELLYPGRHQHRTVVQGAISIDRTRLEASDYAGYRSYELQLVGEVLHDGDLFETFRYRYGFPADGAPDRLAMGFQRYLRPGDFTLVLRLDDLVSGAVYREERPISVPAVDTILEQPRFHDPETERLFAEATAAIAAGETGLRIVPPHETLLTGPTRFATLVSGDEVRKVRFLLDDRVVMTKNRPPFHVEIDLGDFPDLHELRVEGLDAVGEIVADDEIWINGGGYRFLVDLREPRPGARYEQSLQVRVDVEVPDGRTLERLEIYLDEDRIATLFQPPFAHPVVLPRAGHVGYVRAVAYLADGYSTEDL
ncbi:MAG: GWxTD domain-containing protein, partial [Acidobacteriota bacterium]